MRSRSERVRARRQWLFTVACICGAASLAWSCAFPQVQFGDGPGSEDEGGVPNESGTLPNEAGRSDSPSTFKEAGTDAADAGEPFLVDGSTPDALIAKDAGVVVVDASGCTPTKCDCDNDGYNDFTKAGCATGTRDCDDLDSRARPGQLFLDVLPTAKTGGDWNCSNSVEKLYAENISCGALLGLGCNTAGGFTGTVGCGQTGTFVRCKAGLLSCNVDQQYQAKQACR